MRQAFVWLALVMLWAAPASAQRLHDEEIRRQVINDSIARYRGDCPCPYSYAWNGAQCGNNSAYIKRTPDAPYCYPQDVHWREVQEYRVRMGR